MNSGNQKDKNNKCASGLTQKQVSCTSISDM